MAWLLSDGFRRQLVGLLQRDKGHATTHLSGPETPRREHRRSIQIGFLDGPLAACEDPRDAWDDLPTATLNIYVINENGKMVDASRTLTVHSRRDFALEADVYVEVEFKRGKWMLIDANCSATTL